MINSFFMIQNLIFLMAGNVFGLRAGGHLEAQNCQLVINFVSCNTLQITTIRPLAFSPCVCPA